MKYIYFFLFFIICTSLHAQLDSSRFMLTSFPWRMNDVTTGDIDNDGYEDIVFLFNYSLSWSKNIDGEGNWSANILIDNGIDSDGKMVLVDFDGDGFLDIAVVHDANYNAWSKWYRNNTKGGFDKAIVLEEVQDLANSVRWYSIAAEDMDNDGDVDIVIAYDMVHTSSQVLKVYLNEDGEGSFTEGITIADNIENPRFLNILKVNNDEYYDIVITANENEILYFENIDGEHYESAKEIAVTSDELICLTSGDIDGDGDKDILGGTRFSDEIILFENLDDSDDFSIEKLFLDNVNHCSEILCEDLDSDGDIDVSFIAGFDGEMGVLKNIDGQGTFGEVIISTDLLGYSYINNLVTIDLDNDNDLDVIAVGDSQDEYLIMENVDGNGGFEINQILNMAPSGLGNIIINDIDGDGYNDIIAFDSEPLILSWNRYNPIYKIYEKSRVIPVPNIELWYKNVRVNDLDNDGLSDIMFYNSDEKLFSWMINLGNGNFSSIQSLSSDSGNFVLLRSEDIDNDGYADVTIKNGEILALFRNDASGGFYESETLLEVEVKDIEIFDFDGDGDLDILTLDDNTFEIGWLENDGGVFSDWEKFFEIDFTPRSFLVQDINLDGFSDIVVETSFGLYLYLALDEESFFSKKKVDNGVAYENLRLYDYDLDGYLDLLYFDIYDNIIEWHSYDFDSKEYGPNQVLDLEGKEVGHFDFADLDNDGDLDLFYRSGAYYSKNSISSNGSIYTGAYYDINENGIFDADEPLLKNLKFELIPSDDIYFSSSDSTKRFFIQDGEYNLLTESIANWKISPSNSVDIVVEGSAIDTFFGYIPIVTEHDFKKDFASEPTRCGFTIPFWISLKNTGTEISDGLISFQIDQHATFLDASPPPDSISNDTLFWKFNDFAPTYSQLIKIKLEISNSTFLGDTVIVSSSSFVVDDGEYVFHSDDSFKSVIICGVDPNDKSVEPIGFLEDNYVLIDQELVYKIRFQNTGTDTTFNVVITDFIDKDMDINSLEVISSSHYMETEFNKYSRIINFTFPNILLPDSTINEFESHGYVKYKVAPKDSIIDHAVVENRAKIFFDFNAPIITNKTHNTFVNAYPFDIESTIVDPACFGFSNGVIDLEVTGIPPMMYNWENDNLVGSYNENLMEGDYSLTITDGTGTIYEKLFTLTSPPKLISSLSSTPQNENDGGTATISPSGGVEPYGFQWNTEPPQFTEYIEDLDAGVYVVTLSDVHDCSTVDSIEVSFVNGIEMSEYSFDFEIFPNPSFSHFNFRILGDSYQSFELKIIDESGKLLLQDDVKIGSESIFVLDRVIDLKAGIYLVSLSRGDEVLTKKVIIH